MKSPDTNDHRLEALLREALTQEPTAEETERAWQVLASRRHKQRTRRTLYIVTASVAAILAIVFLLRGTQPNPMPHGIQVFASMNAPQQITFTETDGRTLAATPAGTTATILLSDSTKVLLGANSRLEYPTRFGEEVREVTLSGEARFYVAKHEGTPFIVHTQELQTQVFGTVFDVRAYPQGTPDVALYEGSIGVTFRGEEHLMRPGEQAFISTDGALQLTATPSHRSSWAEGYFTYDNQDLRTVMREIGTWYNLSVTFEAIHLLDERIHFRLSRQQPVDVILQVLSDMGIAQFVRREEGIVVR